MLERIKIHNGLDVKDSYQESLYHLHKILGDNCELFLVGGCVRDLLLNREPKDYDLCTNFTPEQIKEKLYDYIKAGYCDVVETGIKHGTITILNYFYNTSFEITTFRKEQAYTDNRHPDEVQFISSLEEDLKRRDFTINSLAYDFDKLELIMLDKSCLNDLTYGIIRTVGNPIERFNEDALRMLRAIRFASQLNFTIQRDTYHAIKELAPKLSSVSKERIRDELTKILLSNKPDMLKLFVLLGLEEPVFGFTPLKDIMECEHENPRHYTDVFHHTMDVVNALPLNFKLRWAALFHDMGKPETKTLKEGTKNYYNYNGHPEASAKIALKIMDTLKFSNEQKDIIYKYVKYHDTPLAEVSNFKFKTIVNEIGPNNFLDFIKLRVADSFAHRLLMDTKFAIDFPDIVKERFIKIIEENQALTLSQLKLNGDDIKELGLEGKQIGEALKYLLSKVMEKPEINQRDCLTKLIKEKFLTNIK